MKPLWTAAVLLISLAFCASVLKLGLEHVITAKLDAAVREQIVWRQDSPQDVHKRFLKDTHPGDPVLLLKLYLFNITNLEEVRQGAKPILAELGPYTYIKHRVKRHVWFNHHGDVMFKEYVYHLPVPELTNGSLEDSVTTLNIPLLGALEAVYSLSPAAGTHWLEILAHLIESWQDARVQGLFTTRTVRELLWGYQDALLSRLAPFLPGLNPTFQLLHNMSSPNDADRAFATKMNTGLLNVSEVWQYEEWENVTKVTSWNPPHVERVRGTDAFQFRPGLGLNDSVLAWVGQAFRAFEATAVEEAVLDSVPVLRFRADPRQGDPDPRYFQYMKGLMNITAPMAAGPGGKAGKPGPPLFLSYPHYCDADEQLAQGVEGLACNPRKHDLYFDVEPTTGITLRAALRLMLSSWFGSKWKAIDPNVQDTFLPIFWMEEGSRATPQQLQMFRPLLRAQAVAAALHSYAFPFAAMAAALAAACAVLALSQGARVEQGATGGQRSGQHQQRQGGDLEGGQGESSSLLSQAAEATAAAAATAAAPPGPPADGLRQPLLSHPFPSEAGDA